MSWGKSFKQKAQSHTMLSLDLVLGNDELDRVGVSSVGDWVVQEANDANDLTNFLDLVGKVGRISNDHFSFDDLVCIIFIC